MKKQCINAMFVIIGIFVIGALMGDVIAPYVREGNASIEYTTQARPMIYLEHPQAIKNFICKGETIANGGRFVDITINEEVTSTYKENVFTSTTNEEVATEGTTVEENVTNITEEESIIGASTMVSEETTVAEYIIDADCYNCSPEDIYYTSPIREYTEEQKELIAKMLFCEANIAGWDCQVAVCSAIINLIEDRGGNFAILDNTNAFTPASYYRYKTPSEMSWQVLDYVLSGHLIANIKYFQLYSYHDFGTPMFMIDGVYFSK